MKIIFKRVASLLTSLCIASASALSITANAVSNKTDITNFSAPANISNQYNPLPSNQYPIRSKDSNSSVYLYLSQVLSQIN